MALSAGELALLRSQLSEAKAALHRLMIGEQAVRIKDQSGEEAAYNVANLTRLKSYIKDLEAQIAGDGTVDSGPIRPVFL